MKQGAIFPKVANDLLWAQLITTFWFFGITFAIQIFNIFRAVTLGNEIDTYYNAQFISVNIFMLVIGIIFIAFLSHFVENGVTRRDYFKGGLLASIELSVIIPIGSLIISVLSQWIVNIFFSINYNNPTLNDVVVEVESNIIGEIILVFIISPYVHPQDHLILSLAIFSLNIFIYYLIGWLIAACFYRFGTIVGLVSIPFSLFLLLMESTLLRISLDMPVIEWLSPLESLPLGITVASVIFIYLLFIGLIRLVTKNTAIKM